MVNPYLRRWQDVLRRLQDRLRELAPETTEEDLAPFGIREASFAVELLERHRPDTVRVSYNSLTDEVYGQSERGGGFTVKVRKGGA